MLRIYGVPIGAQSGHDTAYGLLEHAYEQTIGGRLPHIHRGTWGKPFFLRSDVEFSLSHTKTMAFCAIGDCPVGVDAETIRPVRPRVPERTMNPAELDWIAAFEDRDTAFLRLWTAKEAWAKLTGRGLDGQPRAIELAVGDGAVLGVQGAQAAFVWRRVADVLVTVCTGEPVEPEWVILPQLPSRP